MSIVSNNIKYLRRLNGLTQEQFARRINIKRSLVGAYEESRANPNLDNLKVIAHTFGVSVDNLIKQDIRKLRDTPDLTFGFEQKTIAEPEPEKKIITNATYVGAVLNNIKEQIQPQFQSSTYNSVVSMGAAPKANLKSHYQNVIADTPSPRFNNNYEENTIENKPVLPQQSIQLVMQNQYRAYAQGYQNFNFLNSLAVFQAPPMPLGEYRAFEASQDFMYEGAVLIGAFVQNWFDILDGNHYILLTSTQGIIYRQVYNQVKVKGNLLLKAANGSHEIPIKEVLEAWEIRAFISQKLPEPTVNFDRISQLVAELSMELERFKP